MAIFCIDDGGDGTQTDTTQTAGTLDWSKADTSIANLIATYATALTTSENIIYIGSNTVQTQASALTVTGPTAGAPVILISADITSATPTYLAGTTNQLETTGANSITFDGSFALYGIRAASGANIIFQPDADEAIHTYNCYMMPGAGGIVYADGSGRTKQLHTNLSIDNTADATTPRSQVCFSSVDQWVEIRGITFPYATYRTGSVFELQAGGPGLVVHGADVSGFTNGTVCELLNANIGCAPVVMSNILTAATWTALTSAYPTPGGSIMLTNVGPADAPTMLMYRDYFGDLVSSAAIYRTGGATAEGDATAWLITTTANCAEGAPFYTPWIYGTTTNGTKTFTVYGTCNNSSPTTATLQDDEIWLEVEYLATADENLLTLVTDHRTITATPADQTTESSSTWVGLNDAGQGFADFRFKLECASVSVGESGLFRARVAVGVTSVTSTSYLYIDPKVTVA